MQIHTLAINPCVALTIQKKRKTNEFVFCLKKIKGSMTYIWVVDNNISIDQMHADLIQKIYSQNSN